MACCKWPFEALWLWSVLPQNPSFPPLPSFPINCSQLLSCPPVLPLVAMFSWTSPFLPPCCLTKAANFKTEMSLYHQKWGTNKHFEGFWHTASKNLGCSPLQPPFPLWALHQQTRALLLVLAHHYFRTLPFIVRIILYHDPISFTNFYIDQVILFFLEKNCFLWLRKKKGIKNSITWIFLLPQIDNCLHSIKFTSLFPIFKIILQIIYVSVALLKNERKHYREN